MSQGTSSSGGTTAPAYMDPIRSAVVIPGVLLIFILMYAETKKDSMQIMLESLIVLFSTFHTLLQILVPFEKIMV